MVDYGLNRGNKMILIEGKAQLGVGDVTWVPCKVLADIKDLTIIAAGAYSSVYINVHGMELLKVRVTEKRAVQLQGYIQNLADARERETNPFTRSLAASKQGAI